MVRLSCLSALVQLAWLMPAQAWALSLDSSVSDSSSKRDDPQAPRPAAGTPRPAMPVYGEGDKVEGRTDRDVTLQGNAVVRRDGTVIRGDRITYYEADDEVFVVGNARVVREGNVFVGKELRLKLDTNEGVFTEPRYSLPAYRGLGSAERIEFLGKSRMRFINGYYTTCQGDNPAWCLRAESITLDEEAGEGRARSASLYFGNTKVLGLPVFFFPLGDERKTGFLAPSFGVTSRTGFEMAMPFYWNIAPNYDLTLTPRVMSKRGLMLGSEFRYLSDKQFGTLRYDYLHNDRESTVTDRYHWNWQHTVPAIAKWRIGINAQGVSDGDYFTDFSRSGLASTLRSLPRDVIATRSFGDWNVTARFLRFQNILDAAQAPQYDRMPQFTLTRFARDLNGFDISMVADATLFKSPLQSNPAGWRTVLYPQISYPIQKSGWFITPKIGLHSSVYNLDSNNGNATSLTRAVPIFSLDAGMTFEREATFFDRKMTQTLEPRVFYVRSPYRDQSLFPVFDTADLSFGFGKLFATNPFIGNDRIADQNQLTTALVSKLIDPKSGSERFRFAFGQKWYFSPQKVSVPNGLAAVTDSRSHLLFAASALLENHWSLDGGVEYSVGNKEIPSLTMASRYTPPDGRIFNVALRYQQEVLGQFDTSWRWPVANRWVALGRLNYSLLTYGQDPANSYIVGPLKRGLVESVAGFEYTDDCWVLRVVAQRYAASPTDYRTGLFFQVELSGLGRIGNDPFDILRRNIPGYRPPSVRTETPSRFFGYE